MYHNNAKNKQVFDFTEQPEDDILAKLDYLIDAIQFLLMPTEGRA